MTYSLRLYFSMPLVVYATGETAACTRKPSFLQKAANSSCQCKKWKPTYQSDAVTCGKNVEFYFVNQKTEQDDATLESLRPYVGDEFCTRFYEAIDDDFCVNINMGLDQGQWCFVDSACTNLNGGGRVRNNEKVSWKKCARDKDKMLREYSPEELATLAETAHLDLGLLHKMSYPLLKGHLWKDVAAFWNLPVDVLDHMPEGLETFFPGPDGLTALHQWIAPRWGTGEGHIDISEELREEMQQIVDSGIPHSFDMDPDQHPPHMIVHGKQVFVVLGKLICVAGCGK
eukprot:gnl/TRDRNA2_/TRDRNA2_199604_c0_seq1.p1 gnl/TRDRNA2_/TRDRNA2_199604_c0~~gnl/TRDRNA2_/TRDRNA2_199604_c0_seq1.p1  ORF type:complete len:286 (-),score=52.52 gnl/TRDRNA2_/TRDRNA2_199604_c0_seq1:139-996(-)